jgi:formate dehydrogenase assembly factor FdhD
LVARFLAQIHRAGRLRLHLVGEFKALDAGVEFGVAGAAGVEIAIERAEQVELVALALAIDAFRVVEVFDRRAVGVNSTP